MDPLENAAGGHSHRETLVDAAVDSERPVCDPTVEIWPLWSGNPSGSPVWVPFTYTHVEYLQGDFFGMVMAIASLLPIFIVVGFTTLILFRRDLHTIFFFLGTLLNEGINLVLKRGLGHLRPCTNRIHHGSVYAMPSNHSQFVWFFSVYFTLFLILRLQKSSPTPQKIQLCDWLWKSIVIAASLVAAAVVAYSRAYLHYHSSRQVILGAVIGGLLGVCWFLLVQRIFTPIFPVIASWRISEVFLIRDTTLIPNILFFEYSKQREETGIRMRKVRVAHRNMSNKIL